LLCGFTHHDTVSTTFGGSAIFVQLSMRSFDTLSEVEAWAKVNGGLDAVNEALATGAFGTDAQSIRTALRYVEREELKIAERLDRDGRRERAMSAAEISAQAAQRSAREAYVSRWIAIAAAIIAVLAVVIPAIR
jgi:Arc/MetJ-type ribon-helix-helix transcriptional regulator